MKQTGFTLVELLGVIIILGAIIAIATINLFNYHFTRCAT